MLRTNVSSKPMYNNIILMGMKKIPSQGKQRRDYCLSVTMKKNKLFSEIKF